MRPTDLRAPEPGADAPFRPRYRAQSRAAKAAKQGGTAEQHASFVLVREDEAVFYVRAPGMQID